MFDCQQNAEPDQIDAHLVGHGAEQRHDDEGQFEEVQEKGQHEGQDADHDQESQLATWQVDQQMLDPQVAVDAAERQRKHRRAHQDEHHKTRELGGRVHGLLEQRQRQATSHERHHDLSLIHI